MTFFECLKALESCDEFPRESFSCFSSRTAVVVPLGKCSSTFDLFKSLSNDIRNVSGAQTIYTYYICSIIQKV